MERRSFLAMPAPSFDNCRWCGFELSRGEHGRICPSDEPGKIKISCLVPFAVTSDNLPRFDVVSGTGLMKLTANEPS